MTKAENRAAARAYAAEKERQFREDQERAGRAADLEVLPGSFGLSYLQGQDAR